jgi:hypothetical protein
MRSVTMQALSTLFGIALIVCALPLPAAPEIDPASFTLLYLLKRYLGPLKLAPFGPQDLELESN